MPQENQLIERMDRLAEAWQKTGDRRAIFLGCYSMMTRNMLQALEKDEFDDNVWVAAFVIHFAGYYFTALESFEARRPIPGCWKTAFEAAQLNTHVLHNLILGVNAHINYDLVITLADLLQPEWAGLTEVQRDRRYRDYCRVNRVIGATIDQVQDEIVEMSDRRMQLVDALMGSLDEWLVSRLISRWREEVWERAMELLNISESDQRTSFIIRLENSAQNRARQILSNRLA